MTQNTPKTQIFTLSGYINNAPFSKGTSDIRKTIKSLKPKEILTESYITLSRGDGEDKITNEQRLDFIKTKRVFSDEDSLNIFVQNLLIPFE